jgi:Ca-activated chloride channel family protein
MTFQRPLFLLLLLLLPLLWFPLRKVAGISRAALVLKCLVFTVLVVALADPWAHLLAKRLAITVLMDTSASMPRQSIETGQALLRDLVRKNSGADLRLITFAEHPHLQNLPKDSSKVMLSQDLDPNESMVTDLESALQLALSTFPAQGSRRVLLISDGNENRGSALREALRARERGVAVFSVPTGGTVKLPVVLESVSAPQQVFSGERFTFSLQLYSARPLAGRAWVTSAGHEIGSTPLQLQPGSNPVAVEARVTEEGVSLTELHVSTEDGSQQELFSQAITIRRPHVLYIFPKEDGPSQPLLDTLKRAQIDVQMLLAFPSAHDPQDWDAVLLDDYPDHSIPPEEEAALTKYVFSGGGLIYIAGDKNSQLHEKPETAFEGLLPVLGDPPKPPEEPTALALVMDKSQSMYGPKIDMVRQAARASVATLRPIDKIGVIAFDEVFRWVVPMGSNTNPGQTSRLIDSIEADGATKIYPALQAAIESIRVQKATRKHIVLLTDGLSSPADFSSLLRGAAADHITISTIGVGADVDRTFLQDIANITRGKFYFIEDPKRIAQIISDETHQLQISAIEERPVRAIRVRPVEFADGVDFTQAPRLLGFVKEKAKPDAETILRVQTGEPLLVRWQYGLGRVIAFLSDARSRWSAPWVQWASFGTLWPQMVRDVSHRDRTVRSGVRPGTREGESIVYYDVLPDADKQAAAELPGPLHVTVSAPGQSSHDVPLEETSPGHYEARITADQYGLYRVVSGSPSLNLPEAGFYLQSEERKPQEINLSLLGEISRVTGGRLDPTTPQLLDEKGSYVRANQALWPYWLVLALLIDLVEVAVRKGYFQRIFFKLRRAKIERPGVPLSPSAISEERKPAALNSVAS